ncbi:MAG: type IV secretion system protein VirB11 [Candidatus Aenigmarchaeota archaeon CG_4_9_14_3_um_filter_37_18]|nr:MAG: type IV secretion system protein VirB11 [Candidatus Aenigmarchaeota archaeon CG_4_10_14_3_um_filter_37_21]PJB75142.1 MAG: type IV secretion system protein VirB11 [Candidatus Aenigmarchaeota archaeon CG_4_9_14_3_um_filter_37_18]
MKRKLIFKKLVNGYKTTLKWKERDKPSFRAVSRFEKGGPLEIKGEVSIKKGEIVIEKSREELEGIEIPEFGIKKVSKLGLEKEEQKEFVSKTYPLIPREPEKNEPIMAYAKIQWNPNKNQHEYIVVQPQIPARMKRLITKLKDILEEKLDIDFSKLKKQEAKEYLRRESFKLLDYFRINISETEKTILIYYIERDFLGLGPIEPIMHDPNIEDISCDGINIPIYIFHRDPLLGSISTNIIFPDSEELDSYLIRIAQLCGQSVSVIDPLLQGSLPDGSRVQGTLSTDIARRGSNFTIRKFTESPLTPTHLLAYKTINAKTLAFLWLAVDYSSSVLVSGGTATGKTSFLNILSLFIRRNMKIVSIEDTAELKLLHPHWIPQVARTSVASSKERERGQIDLFDLLRESLRQRPDYIIVGEVRGKEAYVLFQQMATGHPSLATIHADSMEKLIDRLTTKPIDLSPSLLENLDLIVFIKKLRYKGKFTRRVQAVYEITGFNRKNNIPETNPVFEWDSGSDQIKVKNKSITLANILKKTDLSEKELLEEFQRRISILEWLQARNIADYESVSQIINLYYNYPERVMDVVLGEI